MAFPGSELNFEVLVHCVSQQIFHNIHQLPIVRGVESETGNVYPRKPELRMGKCKNQWSQAKILLLRSSGRPDELFSVCSEKTKATVIFLA